MNSVRSDRNIKCPDWKIKFSESRNFANNKQNWYCNIFSFFYSQTRARIPRSSITLSPQIVVIELIIWKMNQWLFYSFPYLVSTLNLLHSCIHTMRSELLTSFWSDWKIKCLNGWKCLADIQANSKKLIWQNFHNHLTFKFTSHKACRNAKLNLKSTTTVLIDWTFK